MQGGTVGGSDGEVESIVDFTKRKGQHNVDSFLPQLMSSTPQSLTAPPEQLAAAAVRAISPPAPATSTPRRSEPQPVRKVNTQTPLMATESPIEPNSLTSTPASLNRSESAPTANPHGSLRHLGILGVSTEPSRKRSQFQITAVATVVGRKGEATDDDLEEISQTSDGSISPSSLSLGAMQPSCLDISEAEGLNGTDRTKLAVRADGEAEVSRTFAQPLTINVDSTVTPGEMPEIITSPPVIRSDQNVQPAAVAAAAQISGLAAVAALPSSLSQVQLGDLSSSTALPRCQREFRVVVVENVEYRRGRWCCVDRGEPVAPPAASHIDVSSLSSGSTDSRPPSLRFESGHLLSASHSNVPSPLAGGAHPHTVTNLPTYDAQHLHNSTDFPVGSPTESDVYMRKISHIAQIISTHAPGGSREISRPKADSGEHHDDHRGCEAPPPSPASQVGDGGRPVPSCPPPTPQVTPINTPSSSTSNFSATPAHENSIVPKEPDKLLTGLALTLPIEPISTGPPIKLISNSEVRQPVDVVADSTRVKDEKPMAIPSQPLAAVAAAIKPNVVAPVKPETTSSNSQPTLTPPVVVPTTSTSTTKSATLSTSTDTTSSLAQGATVSKTVPPSTNPSVPPAAALGQLNSAVAPASAIFGFADWFKTSANLNYLTSSASSSRTADTDVSSLNLFTTGANPPGTNVVAIDNKIEQAMDLVKTHLMYAVREEVEVLKEKIGDLEKKIGRLEWENSVLRESAAPEVLAKLLPNPNGPGASSTSTSPPAGPADPPSSAS